MDSQSRIKPLRVVKMQALLIIEVIFHASNIYYAEMSNINLQYFRLAENKTFQEI